jgi:hypothetical protein
MIESCIWERMKEENASSQIPRKFHKSSRISGGNIFSFLISRIFSISFFQLESLPELSLALLFRSQKSRSSFKNPEKSLNAFENPKKSSFLG